MDPNRETKSLIFSYTPGTGNHDNLAPPFEGGAALQG